MTAKEYIIEHPETPDDLSIGRGFYLERMMKGFAKLHVEEALKEASVKVKYDYIPASRSFGSEIIVDKESILNAYPLDLIK